MIVNEHEVMDYASAQHRDTNHTYGDGMPYEYHLACVSGVGERFIDYIPMEDRNAVRKALLCHDILEDCRVTYNDLKAQIGQEAADIVYAVTDELGHNRTERAEKTYPKIAADPLAIFVKLCDRLANTTYSKSGGKPKDKSMFDQYKREYSNFRRTFFRRASYPSLWIALDQAHDFHLEDRW